jgi:hypothetical protein
VWSHISFSHRRNVLRPLFRMLHGLLRYQRSSALFRPVYLSPVRPSLFCRSDWLANPTACASFRCLKVALSFTHIFRLAPYPNPLPYHFPAFLPSRWSPLRPPALPAPLKTQPSNSPGSPTSPEGTGGQFLSRKLLSRNWLLGGNNIPESMASTPTTTPEAPRVF